MNIPSQNGKKWLSVLSGREKELFSGKIARIARCAENLSFQSAGLMQGKSGAALFFYYYSLFTGEKKYAEKAGDLIFSAYEEINRGFSYPSYASGIAGLVYAVNFLIDRQVLQEKKSEITEPLYPFLFEQMKYEIAVKKRFDFLHGAIGYALVFLNDPLKYRKELEYLIGELGRMAVRENDGSVKWASRINKTETEQEEVYNFGLAHGIPSVICFLARCHSALGDELSKNLAEGALKYIWNNRQDPRVIGSYFPSHIPTAGGPPQKSRMAWCYGDLGTAVSLYRAGTLLQNPEWTRKATEILLFCAERKFKVYDACFCHGTSGIAHLFARAYNYTGLEPLAEAARKNYRHALEMLCHPDGDAGYKMYALKEGWVRNTGLLEGILGVGMSFMAGAGPWEPLWDDALLIS